MNHSSNTPYNIEVVPYAMANAHPVIPMGMPLREQL